MVELFLIFLSFIAYLVYIWLINANVIVTTVPATLNWSDSRQFHLDYVLTHICLWNSITVLLTLKASR